MRKSKKMNSVLKQKRIINTKRLAKNIQHILISSKFDMKENIIETVSKCCRKRCFSCPSLIEGNEIIFYNNKSFKVKHSINCVSKNVIYSIICDNFKQFYIGQTKNELCVDV